MFRRGIRFMKMSRAAVNRISKMIGKSFSPRERKLFRGLTITESDSFEDGLAAVHDSWSHGRNVITLNEKYPYDRKPAILVHELTHELREKDSRRRGVLRTLPNRGADRDLDEAMTEAETIARYNPYRKSDVNEPNYWTGCRSARKAKTNRGRKKAASKAMFKDRKRFTERPSAKRHSQVKRTGFRGNAAPRSARKHFAGSEISTLIDVGENEAIDRFFEHTRKGGRRRIHVRSHPGTNVIKHVRKMVGAIGKLFEWHDGRKQIVKKKKRSGGWYGQSRRHSRAAKKGWRTRRRNQRLKTPRKAKRRR